MRAFQNIFVGFVVSFLGSLPLGYINIAAHAIYDVGGTNVLLPFVGGVVIVEAVVVYGSLVFAARLSENNKLLRYIEVFSIVFLFCLAVLFAVDHNAAYYVNRLPAFTTNAVFTTGLLMSCANFMQLPFWTGWNLFLIANNYVRKGPWLSFLFLFGATAGSVAGILTFVFGMEFLTASVGATGFLAIALPAVFLGMAVFQTYNFVKKRRRQR